MTWSDPGGDKEGKVPGSRFASALEVIIRTSVLVGRNWGAIKDFKNCSGKLVVTVAETLNSNLLLAISSKSGHVLDTFGR